VGHVKSVVSEAGVRTAEVVVEHRVVLGQPAHLGTQGAKESEHVEHSTKKRKQNH